MKTTLALFALIGAVASHAQIPPPPGAPASPATPAAPGAPGGRSFFSRPFGGTNRPAGFPGSPAAPGAAPGASVPGAPPLAPGTSVIAPRSGAMGSSTNYTLPPKGATNIPAGMMKFQQQDLDVLLEYYAELTGRTILRSPQVPQNVKITVHNRTDLTIQEGIDALNTMLGLNGVVMIEEGAKFIKAIPAAAVPQEATQFTTNRYEDLPEAKKVVAQIVQLKNMTPEEVTSIIQPFAALASSIVAVKGSPVLILRDYAENVKRMMEIIEKVDVAMPLDIESVVIPIKYALASDVANVLSGLTAGGSTLTFGSGGGALGGGGGMGMMGSGMGTMGTMGGGFGGSYGSGGYGGGSYGSRSGYGGGGFGGSSSYGGGSYGSRGMGMGTGSTMGSSRGYSGRLDSAVRRATSAAGGTGGAQGDIQLIGNAKIIADERSNALLVFADRRDLPQITNIISKLDVVLPQVLIEALIMEVNLGSGQSLGVSMVQTKQDSGKLSTAGSSLNGGIFDPANFTSIGNFVGAATTNGATTGPGGGFNYFGTYGKDFAFAVNAVANDSRINVLSRPRIQTSTAQQAQIFVGEQRPFVTGSYFSDFGGTGSRSQYALQDIGISLSVQPIINQEGLVTMTIMQDISQVGGTTKIDNNDVPITIHRAANAYVSVHDRDTIILGGFISTTKSKSDSGVPFLKDIPGLGMLFRANTENVQRVELVVLIRPTVLPTPESAALTAAAERDRLPSIKRAQREEEEFNQRQLEKARREEQRYERQKY